MDATETTEIETIEEQQSTDGDGARINDGDRFINSRAGNKEVLKEKNSYVRDNGLNDKK